MTVCRDVLHRSVLGEKDEPITVINSLHIKANALRKKSSRSILSIGRRWGKKIGGGKRAVPAAASSGFERLSGGVQLRWAGWETLCGSAGTSPQPLPAALAPAATRSPRGRTAGSAASSIWGRPS